MSNSNWAEEALKPSDGKYRLLFENANEAIVVLQDGIIKFFNPQFIKISGYQEHEFRSRPFLEFIYPDDREMVIKYHQRRLRGEDLPRSYICRAIHKDGHVKWMEVSGVLITWEGKPATLNFLSDVTERKLAEEKFLFQASLLDQVNNAVIATDLQGDIIYWNKFAERLYQWKAEEVLGKNISETIVPNNKHAVMIDVMNVTKNAGHCDGEFTVKRKDGTIFQAFYSFGILNDTDSKMAGFVGVSVDITEHIRVEDELHKKDIMLSALSIATNILLTESNLNRAINQTLELLGGATGVDRVNIFKNRYSKSGELLVSRQVSNVG